MSFCRYRSLALPVMRNAAVTLAAGACVTGSVFAGFGVSPIRVDLDRSARTGSITVSNDDTESAMRAQADAVSWVQDADGNDHFEATGELTFLPRIMTIAPSDRQLVRVGIRVPATTQEKAFRLFIEELPEPQKPDGSGAKVAVRVRFGIPVFVKPLKEEIKGDIDLVEISNSTVKLRVRNEGNVHLGIKSVELTGDGFSKQVGGWYLLAGAARTQSIEIPVETCRKLKALDVTLKTDQQLELKRRLEIDRAACG